MSDLTAQLEEARYAERAVLGSSLLSLTAARQAIDGLTEEDFLVPTHQAAFRAIQGCVENESLDRSGCLDFTLVAAGMGTEGAMGFVGDLIRETTWTVSNAHQHIRWVRDLSARRRLISLSVEMRDLTVGKPGPTEVDEVIARTRVELEQLDAPDPEPRLDAITFADCYSTEPKWLVPDVLERGDRLIVTAEEGAGKSMLVLQFAAQIASGIHPWRWHEPIPPARVLYVDLENSRHMVARRIKRLQRAVGDAFDPYGRLFVEVHTSGINLLDVGGRKQLRDMVRRNSPALLVIGPTYRMQSGLVKGDVGGEDQARIVTAALDEVRVEHDLAMILETHAPHASGSGQRDLRPFGSSVWLRWPEFGYGLRPVPDVAGAYDWRQFRGPREHRTWPRRFTQRGEPWPWKPQM